MKKLIFKKTLITTICICTLNLSCEKKTELINVTIKVVDSETKKARKNDTLEIRIGKPSLPMREYHLVGKYILNQSGESKIKIQKNEIYRMDVWGKHTFGSTEFKKGELKNDTVVVIEIVPAEKRKIKL